jgi:aryl-alcohol dehydrogenase-like predicted oxidoreductase
MGLLPRRALGRTGLDGSVVGLGGGPLGDARLSDGDAERLVRTAIDLGVTLIDTAPSYGQSEPRVGRAIAPVRDRVTLVTKGGYGVPGEADWTPGCVARGVDAACDRMGVDRIDVFLLHSCPLDRLAAGDLIAPLVAARASGRVRAIGYSGDGDALSWAVRAGAFDVVECSVSVFDQRALARDVPEAHARGLGVLAKRAMGNAAWTCADAPPDRADVAEYRRRMLAMRARGVPAGLSWEELAVRFAAHAPGVSCALVGTARADHLRDALVHASRGPLDHARGNLVTDAFAACDEGWAGVV